MPLYDFRCRSCGERFEARTPADVLPVCPSCRAPDAERLLSGFAGPFTVGVRGAEARRSNAQRRVREEQRLEDRARRQEERRERGERSGLPSKRPEN
jgi:putative FmdB family regulatory protein